MRRIVQRQRRQSALQGAMLPGTPRASAQLGLDYTPRPQDWSWYREWTAYYIPRPAWTSAVFRLHVPLDGFAIWNARTTFQRVTTHPVTLG